MKPDKNNPQKEEEMIEGPGDPDSSGGPTPAPIKLPGTTQRLSLRRFNKTDAPILGQLFNDREIASNTRTFDFPYNQQMAEEWIGKHQLGWEVGEGFVFAIERSSDGELLGAIGLHVNKEDHQAELGYTIGREFWGQGFCTEAARSVVEFGFDEVGLHKITSHHMIRNPASGRVLQKIGMTHEGTFRGHVRKWGVFEDIEVYGMLADDKRA